MDGGISGERAAHNQSLYRSINEKIEELNQTFEEAGLAGSEWICECADTDCTVRVEATLKEYETVRSDSRTFIVSLGHVYPDVERVLNENDRFMVVEKFDDAGRAADALDPRQSRG